MSNKILIIEDDEDICQNMRIILESEGYVVETACNGREALDHLRASTVLPLLIILDLMLPLMDGYHFRKEQEEDARLTNIPIIVTTAGGNIESKKFKIGATAFLKKPINIDDVLEVVKRITKVR